MTVAEHFDVVIVGAGLSGIGAAVHLQRTCPGIRYSILEARSEIGGTWDLFRYPGVRSDSDMHTLGYSFKPWTQAKAITDGSFIKRYIEEAAAESFVSQNIRRAHRLRNASWSSELARWSLEVDRVQDGHVLHINCNFLLMCSGYYSYDEGHRPTWPHEEKFLGRILHPQFWPEDAAYRGKRVIVIGSGATAVTLVPALGREASHVTMLQRSPTYVISAPSKDAIATLLKRVLPSRAAYAVTRWKNVLIGLIFFKLARKYPDRVKRLLLHMVRTQLDASCDVSAHFSPSYAPWDQRLCVVPDADMFEAINEGRASVVTGTIERFTERGILLASGQELSADMIVTATGLKLSVLGDVSFTIDGRPLEIPGTVSYKGCMLSDVPNLAYAFGYTNAAWTLKAELTSRYICRVLARMKKRNAAIAVAPRDPRVQEQPFLDFSSGYVQRALHLMPKQGSKRPWKLYQNYFLDLFSLRFGRVEDGALKLLPAPQALVQSARSQQ